MPQANITYDAPYNRNLVNVLHEMDEKHWQKAGTAYHPSPLGYRLGAFHGGMVGGGSSPLKYNPAGNSPAYPPASMRSGLAVSSGGSRYSGVDGAVGGYSIQDFGRDLGNVAKEVAPYAPLLLGLGKKPRKSRAKKGGYSFNQFLSDAGDVLAPVAKEVAPVLIKSSLGLGRKSRAKKGGAKSGGFSLQDALDYAKPIAKDVAKSVGKIAVDKLADYGKKKAMDYLEGKGKGKTDGRAKRAEIVKKVMREKGLKMIEASKYVKAHGLY